VCGQLFPAGSKAALLGDPISQSGSYSVATISDLHSFSLSLIPALLFLRSFFLGNNSVALTESLEHIKSN